MGWLLTVPKDYCEDTVDYLIKILEKPTQEGVVIPSSYKLEAREEPGVLVLIDE